MNKALLALDRLAQDVIPRISPDDLKAHPDQKVFGDPEQLISETFIPAIIGILTGVAVMFVIWSGYQYFTSAGDPAKAEKARANLTYAIVGVILMVLAYGLVAVVNSLIQQSAGQLR